MATPRRQREQENLQGVTLLLAFELGLKTWNLGVARSKA
jgi:hypothetical protein